MLFFRDHEWMLAPSRSVFNADIRIEHRTGADIDWRISLHFLAGGARWRRVQADARPALEAELCFFKADVRHWTELDRVNYWNFTRRESLISDAGWLETRYRPEQGEDTRGSVLNDHIWRIAKRDGRFFTLELAAFADGRDVFRQLASTAVAPDGEEIAFEPDGAFWKANAQLYLIEEIPFGIVRVEVPRNVRDPETYARRRVHAWLGLDAPAFSDTCDFAIPREEFKETSADLHVQLHYHDRYEH